MFWKLLAMAPEATFWMPRQSSTVARDVDWNWGLIYWISMPFFIGVTFAMCYFAIRYRGRRGAGDAGGATHNTSLEIFWSVVPSILVVFMFWNGYKTYLDMATPPQNAYEVLVTAQKWNWLFQYPNGHVDGELHVPVNTPVRLVMSSEDVLHSFYVPEFRVKRDVVPGRYDKVWFDAVETGEFWIQCAEYCGTSHWDMKSKLIVHERGDFEAWLQEAADLIGSGKYTMPEVGEIYYSRFGCKQCHSVDGSNNTGPSFLGKWGSQEALQGGGSVEVDENYIRESILHPQAKLVAGYEPVMPTYQGRLKDQDISAIIEYLKTLAE